MSFFPGGQRVTISEEESSLTGSLTDVGAVGGNPDPRESEPEREPDPDPEPDASRVAEDKEEDEESGQLSANKSKLNKVDAGKSKKPGKVSKGSSGKKGEGGAIKMNMQADAVRLTQGLARDLSHEITKFDSSEFDVSSNKRSHCQMITTFLT